MRWPHFRRAPGADLPPALAPDSIPVSSRVTVVGFREFLAPALLRLEALGAEILDIEDDLGGFDLRLDRTYDPDLPMAG